MVLMVWSSRDANFLPPPPSFSSFFGNEDDDKDTILLVKVSVLREKDMVDVVDLDNSIYYGNLSFITALAVSLDV